MAISGHARSCESTNKGKACTTISSHCPSPADFRWR